MKYPVKTPYTFNPRIGRRKLLECMGAGALSTGVLSGLSVPVLAQQARATNRNLGNGLAVISGTGCNILVKQAGTGDILVVDGGLERFSDRTMDAIATSTRRGEITRLMNTHWHEEQTGLNRVLGQMNVPIFAHENTRQWLSTDITRPWEERTFKAMPDYARPGETFYHYGDLDHGGATIQYGYLRQAHTDGDMYVYFPEENVLHGGGVVSNDGWPLVDWWTGGWIGGLVDGLEILLEVANNDTVIVPANGPLMNRDQLQEMRDMYNVIFQRISQGFRAANSVEVTLSEMPTAEFNDKWGDPEQFIRRCHESLVPHLTPDA